MIGGEMEEHNCCFDRSRRHYFPISIYIYVFVI